MPLIGYARVSTEEQSLGAQLDALRAAGCAEIVEEQASGGARARPRLRAALERVGPGDTLVVARIDRLARSLSHLLEVVEGLRARGAHFRSLADPIDTTSPSGVLVLQMLGAVAEFERSLIRERTRAGLAASRARGRVGGHPGLRARDAAAVRRLAEARAVARLERLGPVLRACLPEVLRLRAAAAPWAAVAAACAGPLAAAQLPPLGPERLARAVRLAVSAGMAPPAVLSPAPRRPPPGGAGGAARARLVGLVAALAGSRPGASLSALGGELLRLRVRPPGGGACWAPSSVKALLDRARAEGLLGPGAP